MDDTWIHIWNAIFSDGDSFFAAAVDVFLSFFNNALTQIVFAVLILSFVIKVFKSLMSSKI